jgi:N-acetyl sugar amidotransferase
MNSINIEKKNVIKLYNLPEVVKFCKKCTISNQRPRISFDKNDICSACKFSDYKRSVNWQERDVELKKLADKYRKNNGEYDILIPCSGGKDGDYVAHQMKYEYGMNPLTVTWAPLSATEIGRINLDNFIKSGFNHILGTPDPVLTKKLTQLSFKFLGDPFQPFIYGQLNFPLTVAVQNDIKLIMYGENGEVEYGGNMTTAYQPSRVNVALKSSVENQAKYTFSGVSPKEWTKYGLTKEQLKIFEGPSIEKLKEKNIEVHYFSYYKFWDPQENFYYAQEKCGFIPNSERSEGTYSKYASLDDEFDGFHYYLGFIKFGIGRATSDTAHEIRDKKINRDEGIALVQKYDGEFPKKHFKKFLDYCSIDEDTFEKIIDSWRSEHIWFQDNKKKWQLKNTIWK